MEINNKNIKTLINSKEMKDFIEDLGNDMDDSNRKGKAYNMLGYCSRTRLPLSILTSLALHMRLPKAVRAFNDMKKKYDELAYLLKIKPSYFSDTKFSCNDRTFTKEDALELEIYMKEKGLVNYKGVVESLVMTKLKNGKLPDITTDFIEDRIVKVEEVNKQYVKTL